MYHITCRNPNGANLPAWPQYTLPQRQYLNLNTKPTVGTQLRGDKEKFWRQDALPLMTSDPMI